MRYKKINKLLIGTNNRGKLREIRNLLPKNIKTFSTSDFNLKSPKENGKTFQKNSQIKSKYFYNTSASLIHKSISEMAKFVTHYGGKSDTVYGLAGLGDLYVSAIGGRNSQMGKYLGEGYLYKEAKEKFMNEVTVEGAELAIEVGTKIKEDLGKKDFPLMLSIIDCICDNKKLEISW